jgi:peroxiredoxin Q/BCP
MSKKTRKKSSKPSAGKAIRAQSRTAAKAPAAKARLATAGKPGKKAGKKTSKKASKKAASANPRAPRKSASTQFKSTGAAAPLAAVAPKPAAAKPEAVNAPARKPLPASADAVATGKSALAEGAKAPAFRLPRDGGETVSLADFSGRKLVLFFYPRADTPGCTKEAIDFTRLAGAFAESQTAILGVSADPLKAQEAFRNKHQLTTPLVSDESHGMLEAYGAWGEKSMYGRTFQGILRTTVLIGADGRIIRIWRHVKVDGHADEVLAAVRAL